jgi:hypothetical protein
MLERQVSACLVGSDQSVGGDATIRHRLSALAEYLCACNAVTHNPVKGVARPKSESGEGKTPALGDHQARKLLDAPEGSKASSPGSLIE